MLLKKETSLSILFYEDFFLQVAWTYIPIGIAAYFFFQSSFMRISFCKSLPHMYASPSFRLSIAFQSSFMRISFCKKTRTRRNHAFSIHLYHPFQSSFMRISFCKPPALEQFALKFAGFLPLSILFYEDFFLQGPLYG